MDILIIVGAIIYAAGVVLFTFYAAVMSKGWGDSYQLAASIRFGLEWPLTLLRIARKRRS